MQAGQQYFVGALLLLPFNQEAALLDLKILKVFGLEDL